MSICILAFAQSLKSGRAGTRNEQLRATSFLAALSNIYKRFVRGADKNLRIAVSYVYSS